MLFMIWLLACTNLYLYTDAHSHQPPQFPTNNDETQSNFTDSPSASYRSAGDTYTGPASSHKSTDNSQTKDEGDEFDLYRSKIEISRKLKEGRRAVQHTLRSSTSEHCDWRVSPLRYLKGEHCGKHYKIFGLNRHLNESTSKEIKKRYRKLSLLLHPDKNSGQDAPEAFSFLTDGYNCLTNSECRSDYDAYLHNQELSLRKRREAQVLQMSAHLQGALEIFMHYMSWAAVSIEQGIFHCL